MLVWCLVVVSAETRRGVAPSGVAEMDTSCAEAVRTHMHALGTRK